MGDTMQIGEDVLRRGMDALGMDDAIAPALLAYRDLLARWNRVYNLSAVRDPGEMVPRHLLDSLSVLPWLPSGRLLDVGTGAGLPGIPIALAQPDRSVTLLECNGKKVRFIRQACLELGLGNVVIAPGRLESFTVAEPFNGVICRAFTDAAGFWDGVVRLLAPRGEALAMKGRRETEELAALAQAGVSCQWQPLVVPGLDAERHLLIMKGQKPVTG